MTTRTSRRAAACALLTTTFMCAPSIARAEAPAPRFVAADANGVDLTTGLVSFDIDEGGIGSGPGAVRMKRIWAQSAGFVDNWSGGLFKDTVNGVTKTYVQIGGISETFTESAGTFTNEKANGATLALDTVNGRYVFTAADGTQIIFPLTYVENTVYSCPGADPTTCVVPSTITRPDGLKFTLAWKSAVMCIEVFGDPCGETKTYQRLKSVTSSAGYSLNITYLTDTTGSGTEPVANWWKRSTVTFSNSALAPSPVPTISYAYPTSTIVDVTDPAGRVWRLTNDSSSRLTGVRRPGSASDNITYTYGADGLVSSAAKDGVTTSYARTNSGSTRTTTVTNALNQQSVITSDMNIGRPTSAKDALNRTTSFTYDTNARLTRSTEPEGNYVQLTYNGRGNVTQQRAVAKSGSGLADIVTSASFDATCSNLVKCNKPNSTTDGRGNVTNYTYDATHGGLLTATLPAPSSGAVRPQTRYSYTQVHGASTASLYPAVYMLTGVSACQTQASCAGAADETKVTAAYNSNLLATSVTRANGTGTLAATTAATYDASGNLLTVDGPLTGTADTTRYRYDSADQLVGVTSPDPDGASALKNRAARLTFRPDGQVSKQELGTVNSQSDADWTAFSPIETVDITFNANSRPVVQKLSSGTTTYALTHLSYDAIGRPECSAQRMNTGAFGSLPASACTLGTQGSHGPDRILKTVYDAAGQVTQARVAVGTAAEAAERSLTYTTNGALQTLTDAENNRTTYEYDGHDRLLKTRYPSPTKGAGTSSTTDYEQLGYDPNSNATSRRLRDGQTIAFTFDALNRPTLKDLPGTEPDVTYGYDNLGRLTSASQTGSNLTFTYDALSRNLTQVGPQGTVASEWDLADRRTKLTYPGTGLYINYDYLVTGETTKVRENAATSGVGVLATYAYDNVGRRTSRTFGTAVVQSYAYDPVSRLTSLTNDLGATANDLTIGSISYNPASQIVSQNRSNETYAWTGHGSGSTDYIANGLNQLTSVGGAATAHDARGNLTSDPTTGKTYGYSSENMLTSASGAMTLAYDPLLRLRQVAGTATTRFAYDGLNMIAEYNGSNTLQRRFVHGPVVDEPIVQYEGSGTTDRRFLSADERGSIISISDSAGSSLTINRYDEFGKPQSTNSGRFQYTGQMWLSELGLYHYKARMYSPKLGRFFQTDPIGYGAGMNMYAYVGNDPVNFTDPLGLSQDEIIVTGRRLPIEPPPPHDFGMGGFIYIAAAAAAAAFGDRASNDGGGDGGDGDKGAKPDPCAVVAAEAGRVELNANTVSLVFGAGINFTYGTFRNLRTGSTGTFTSRGAGLGLDVGISHVYGWASSVGALTGYSETGSVSWSLGRVGATGSVSYDANNQVIGSAGGASAGPSTGTRAGGSVVASDTTISNCKVGGS